MSDREKNIKKLQKIHNEILEDSENIFRNSDIEDVEDIIQYRTMVLTQKIFKKKFTDKITFNSNKHNIFDVIYNDRVEQFSNFNKQIVSDLNFLVVKTIIKFLEKPFKKRYIKDDISPDDLFQIRKLSNSIFARMNTKQSVPDITEPLLKTINILVDHFREDMIKK